MQNKFLEKIKKDVDEYEQARIKLIQQSSGNLKLSKKVIFQLHRDEFKEADSNLKFIEKNISEIEKTLIKKMPALRFEGSYKAFLEEYAEAKILYIYLKTKKISPIKEAELSYTEYIGGLCDFTGELVRRATLMAIKGEYKVINEYYDAIQSVMNDLLEFNLSSYLRTKGDQMKRNMKKMEEILYDVHVKLS